MTPPRAPETEPGPHPRLSPAPRGSSAPGLRAVRSAPRPRCLLVDLRERGLSSTLRGHLAAELPSLEFLLSADEGEPDAVWAFGHGPASLGRLREVRALHPATPLLVTSGEGPGRWEADALAAGADRAITWPASLTAIQGFVARAAHDARAAG